jgi:hypothetical protein
MTTKRDASACAAAGGSEVTLKVYAGSGDPSRSDRQRGAFELAIAAVNE